MIISKARSTLRQILLLTLSAGLFTFAASSQAGTLVRINTSLGGMTLELFDDVAPKTVANFLSYVNSGRYDGTFIHRSEPGFVIQGGWLKFTESNQSLFAIPTYPNVQNEFSISNTRGTVAMAKVAGDPDSANSQWFINLVDNIGLDSSNGGFTVFGRIVDNGMVVADAVAGLNRYALTSDITTVPLINFQALPLKSENMVNLAMSVMTNTSGVPNVFDTTSSLLYTTIDAGADGVLTLAFSLYSLEPEVVIQALASSLVAPVAPVAKMATFNGSNGQITIPEFVVNGEVAYRNVVFELSDANQLLFRLVSVE